MVQRVVRQINESKLDCQITFATSEAQRDSIISQLGEYVSIVTEPARRDTFPAICLASTYLKSEKCCTDDEVVVVMPCDPFTETGYFDVISEMADAVNHNIADLVLMGIKPTYPSAKYGYIVPQQGGENETVSKVRQFSEKPDVKSAEKLISCGAMWNGGVFAFRLGYILQIARKYLKTDNFDDVRSQYSKLSKISFDYEVVEKADSIAVIKYNGHWKDLGTWNTLTDEIKEHQIGNVILDERSHNTHVINELEIPIMCIGLNNVIVAASSDGIIVSDKYQSENIKQYADKLARRPMYEERRWGEYKVIDDIEFKDGHKALSKQLTIKAGKNISYQLHNHRDEVWTIIEGNGRLVLDGEVTEVHQGSVIYIHSGVKHAIMANSDLYIIEVQLGDELIEGDIERFDYNWK